MNEQTVPRCEIQEGCVHPHGHMGNCQPLSTLSGLDPRTEIVIAVHAWPDVPTTIRSGKLEYEICPRCNCIHDHPVHGWVPEPASNEPPPAPEPESIDFLMSRVLLCIPEPSLMDIEDGGPSQDRLLRRAHTLAVLYQAKYLEQIARQVEDIAVSLERGIPRLRDAILGREED